MSDIIFIIIAGGILAMIWLAFKARKKDHFPNKNERLFSNAWKRIGGRQTKFFSRSKLAQSSGKSFSENYTNESDDFLKDMLLRKLKSRRAYYREVYLQSSAWQRKRFLVLKRDNWHCVHCGKSATQVHHKKYARAIGKEPIAWLESVCKSCHENIHC